MVPTTRRRAVTTFAAALAGALATTVPAQAAVRPAGARPVGVRPLRRAHAHNDYLHTRPLHDALDHGFTSVEADVFLVDGELLVAHEPAQLDPRRTLARLYLEPLLARIRANHGSVYLGHHRPVQLLIDIKNDGVNTYRELHRQLAAYRMILTTYAHGRVRPAAVTAVVSGDRAARAPMEAQHLRHAFYDGRLDDLAAPAPGARLLHPAGLRQLDPELHLAGRRTVPGGRAGPAGLHRLHGALPRSARPLLGHPRRPGRRTRRRVARTSRGARRPHQHRRPGRSAALPPRPRPLTRANTQGQQPI